MHETHNSSPHAFVVSGSTDTTSFSPSHRGPHIPVLAAFGSGPMHRFRLIGRWDLERAATENTATLLRSDKLIDQQDKPLWDDLTFQFAPRSLLFAASDCLEGYAATATEAEGNDQKNSLGDTLWQNSPVQISVRCIRLAEKEITLPASLDATSFLSDSALALHYGPEAPVQHRNLLQRMRLRQQGFVLLQGPQGTGKKVYARHLIFELRESHRFYFVPPAIISRVLSDDAILRFWIDQRCRHPKKTFALILEDCEDLFSMHCAEHEKTHGMLFT